MIERLDWTDIDKREQIVDTASRELLEGGIVAFPTETVYGLAALATRQDAVDKLVELKDRSPNKPFALAVDGYERALGFCSSVSDVGMRLMRRCWPGPVTIVAPAADIGDDDLAPSARPYVIPSGSVGLRVPAHEAILSALDRLGAPLILSSANRAGAKDATTADEVADAVGTEIAMLVDDGPTRFGSASSVVELRDEGFSLLREGVLTETRLRRLASEVVTFVCTGNSCRSPMAEAIFKRLLADELECPVERLPEFGFTVLSAGLAAFDGGPAAESARIVAREYRTTLDDHVSQRLSSELVDLSDRLIVMTEEHRRALIGAWPKAAGKTTLLGVDEDVADPIGQPLEAYRACAEQMARRLRALLERLRPKRAG